MKDWKDAIAYVVVMQMLVTAMLVDRWAGEE
jgi:hypothetical protein